jgi:hypothetical protein
LVTHSAIDSPHPVRSLHTGRAYAARYQLLALGFAILASISCRAQSGQMQDGQPQNSQPPSGQPQAPPDAPMPQADTPASPLLPTANSCDVTNAGGSMAETAATRALAVTAAGSGEIPNPRVVSAVLCVPHLPIINWYARFLNGPQVMALTPLEKAHLAGRNLVDPFNILTILGFSAISVAANSHSVYGPGFDGWGKNVGVSFTQDMVGEFFGTFLIPSIARQDPHYHRMPDASIKRRAFHCIAQIAWTQGDNGKGMVNYADLVGFAFEDGVNDLYVPGQKTNIRASAARYGTALGTAPIDNFITEFLPDIASRIHVRVVLVQRIINQVARTNNTAQ